MITLKRGVRTDPFAGRKFCCEKCGCEFALEGAHEVRRNYYEPDLCVVECPTCGEKRTFADWSGGDR